MKIISPVFNHNEEIPQKYTGLGLNINPPLQFKDFPQNTKSLVLWIEDQDAKPQPWIHWLVFNIPQSTMVVKEGSTPAGAVEGLANNKTFGYEGPNQKYFKGTHRYFFKAYALDAMLDIPAKSDLGLVKVKMQGHVVDRAQLLGLCTAK